MLQENYSLETKALLSEPRGANVHTVSSINLRGRGIASVLDKIMPGNRDRVSFHKQFVTMTGSKLRLNCLQ